MLEIGESGQEKLLAGKVLIVGAGGLGSPVSLYLAAAGVGTIGIIDKDFVELSNLQRQILYTTKDLGKPKTESAREKLTALNPDVNVVTHQVTFDKETASGLIKDYDVIVDCTDNFPARYILNETCAAQRKPFIHAGVYCFNGQIFTIIPGKGPCFKCIFHEPPSPESYPASSSPGILGVVAGILGLLEANEVIKILTKTGEPLVGSMLIFDASTSSFRKVPIPRNPDCPVCRDIS